MAFNKWYGSQLKKMKWYDIKLAKWSAFFFALFLAKVWPDILGLDWYWYLIIAIVVAIPPLVKVMKK
ncbi:hypothetical protein KY335_05940 [Candidatus Woesearchaeota archaeon]|nr:hypothetical protein [Candidatus Woesearchaeota archaeon]